MTSLNFICYETNDNLGNLNSGRKPGERSLLEAAVQSSRRHF